MTLEEAIKHAEEQEPCGNAISRKELDKALYKNFHEEDSPNNITYVTLGAVRNFIKDFPSITPQPKTGHWIDCKCSKCGYVVQPWNTTNFCPNCGVKMVELQKSKDKK